MKDLKVWLNWPKRKKCNEFFKNGENDYMEFIDILKRLKGAYVFLGLVDLTDISGEIKSINDDGEIAIEIGEN